jgi:hypothetical protein
MIGGKRHDMIPSIILLADTKAILIREFQLQKYTISFYLWMDFFFKKNTFLF